jgi:DNA replication protein DnaD
MSRMIYDYTKEVLEKASFDPKLFAKELRKAIRSLLPYEIEQLKKWLNYFTMERPDLKECLFIING